MWRILHAQSGPIGECTTLTARKTPLAARRGAATTNAKSGYPLKPKVYRVRCLLGGRDAPLPHHPLCNIPHHKGSPIIANPFHAAACYPCTLYFSVRTEICLSEAECAYQP